MADLPKQSHIKLGSFGEDLAVEYLKKLGYKIIDRNFRRKRGEIDIIVKSGNGVLVFVEVKTIKMGSSQYVEPEEQMTYSKMKKFKRAVELFVGENQRLVNEKKGFRLDLIAIKIGESGEAGIKQYENIY